MQTKCEAAVIAKRPFFIFQACTVGEVEMLAMIPASNEWRRIGSCCLSMFELWLSDSCFSKVRAPVDSPLRQVLWQDSSNLSASRSQIGENIQAGWLICWVAETGDPCKPRIETTFVFKVYIICNQSGTQGGRSTCTNEGWSRCIVVQIMDYHQFSQDKVQPRSDRSDHREYFEFIYWPSWLFKKNVQQGSRNVRSEIWNHFSRWVSPNATDATWNCKRKGRKP